MFSPKKWHGTCPWVGERWVITVFVSRGWDHLSQEERDELRRLDFPVPNCETQEAYPLKPKPRCENVGRKMRKSVRSCTCCIVPLVIVILGT